MDRTNRSTNKQPIQPTPTGTKDVEAKIEDGVTFDKYTKISASRLVGIISKIINYILGRKGNDDFYEVTIRISNRNIKKADVVKNAIPLSTDGTTEDEEVSAYATIKEALAKVIPLESSTDEDIAEKESVYAIIEEALAKVILPESSTDEGIDKNYELEKQAEEGEKDDDFSDEIKQMDQFQESIRQEDLKAQEKLKENLETEEHDNEYFKPSTLNRKARPNDYQLSYDIDTEDE